MNRHTTLLVAALAVAVLTLGAALVVPGALADVDEPVRPAHLDHRESSVQAGAVTGETVTLRVQTRVGHDGGPARNVTVELRAIDAESGLLVDSTRSDLGTLSDAKEYNATTTVTVPREGGYDLRTVIYVDGERRTGGTQSVSGVGTLVPEYARTQVAFRSFPSSGAGEIPPVVYSIGSVDGDAVTLDVTPFLTNGGDSPESGLELVVMARQADSNIVADRTTVDLGTIPPGQTVEPSLDLTVPDDYNYYLDAMLRRDGVVVATTSVPASLDPTETIPQNTTTREVGLETGDFERDRDGGDAPPREEAMTEGSSGPGFGVTVALVALLALAGLYARRTR